MKRILSIVLCLAMVVGFFTFGVAAETTTATLVTNVSDLAADDQIIIVGRKANNDPYALSTTQNNNNRGQVAVTASGDNITLSAGTQILTLEAGTTANTFSFNTGSGYLYAASSSSNYLRTETIKSANSSFSITIASDGKATVTAQGTNTRNLLCYNTSSGIFGCYGSKQQDIYIYKLGSSSGSGNQGGGTGSENQGGSGSENQGGGTGTTPESDGYTYTKVIAANGLVTGYYTMVTSENIAPMVFDDGWVTKATPAFSEGNLINSYGAIWHLDVTGSTVKLTDINKVTIKPKSGNNNGIQSGSYDWAWTFANGTFSFSGTGDDTTTLAYNVQNAGFRAYKNKTIEDYSDDYLTDFTLYKVEGYTGSGNQGGGTQTPTLTQVTDLADGKYVIWDSTKNKALSSKKVNTYYNFAADLTANGSNISGYTYFEVWDLTKNADDTYTIKSGDNEVISLGNDTHTSMNYTGTNNTWKIMKDAENNLYIENAGRAGCYMCLSSYGTWDASATSPAKVMITSVASRPEKETLTLKPISDALAATSGTFMVKGVVTFVEKSGESNYNIYIQDATGGICGRLPAANFDVALGDTVIVTGDRSTFNGLPQLTGTYEKTTGMTLATVKETNKVSDITLDYLCKYVQLTATVKSVTSSKIVLTDGTTDIDWHKPVVTDLGIKAGDIVTVKGAVGVYSNKAQIRNTAVTEVDIVCSCTSDDLTWKTEGNQHWQECACGNRPISKCSTELETKYNDNKHWDECPDCDFATAELDHTMAPQKDATHHWTACACGKATDKVEHDPEYKSDETHHWQECKDCDHSTEATKEAHNFGTTYKKDAENHYLECVCGKQNDKGAHNDGDDADKLCDKCGLDMSCTHANGYKWNHDATSHWEECKDCGVEKAGTKAAHTLDGKFDADKHWKVCTNENCGYATEKVAHTMEPQKNDTHHWTECDCGHASEKVAHTMDTKKDDTHHWTECSCGHATDKVKHTLTAGKCTCGYAVSVNSSIKDALAGEKNNEFTVTGIVNLIDGKNVYIQDSTGGICIYLSAAPEGLKLGDTITATGKRDTYNGLPELVQATYEKVADSILELKPAEKTLETLTAADVGTYVTLKDLTVVEIFDNNGAYTTPNITVEDAKGNKIQIYKAKVEKVGEGWSVKVGDKLTITASVGIYKETLQLRNTVAGEIVVNTANSQTGDIFGVFVAMMAVSGMGLTVVLKKKH